MCSEPFGQRHPPVGGDGRPVPGNGGLRPVEGVVEALGDYSSNVGETIAQFAATEDANALTFQNIANSSGVN